MNCVCLAVVLVVGCSQRFVLQLFVCEMFSVWGVLALIGCLVAQALLCENNPFGGIVFNVGLVFFW